MKDGIGIPPFQRILFLAQKFAASPRPLSHPNHRPEEELLPQRITKAGKKESTRHTGRDHDRQSEISSNLVWRVGNQGSPPPKSRGDRGASDRSSFNQTIEFIRHVSTCVACGFKGKSLAESSQSDRTMTMSHHATTSTCNRIIDTGCCGWMTSENDIGE